MIHSNQSGLSFLSSATSSFSGSLKGSLIGKEENFVINAFGFFTGETFVFVIETTGLQSIQQGGRGNQQFFAIVGFHNTAYLALAAKLNFICFHIILLILMVYYVRVH